MCGRYRLSRRKQIIEEYFDTTSWDEDWNPRYNIAVISDPQNHLFA
jgi:putative SOS response-associated peptidase YedK